MRATTSRGQEVLELAERETAGWKMMIGGKWVESKSGKRFPTLNPSLDEPIAEVPEGSMAMAENDLRELHLAVSKTAASAANIPWMSF